MNTKTLRSAVGTGLALCWAAAASANTLVTFQVDMSTASLDPSVQTVAVRGNFNNWGSPTELALTNNPTGPNPSLWSGTANIAQNETVIAYKFVIEPGATYEGSHNRLLTLPSNSGASISALPVPYFNDSPPSPVTISVTFQVDMAQQIALGAFDPVAGVVEARGLFSSWSNTTGQTNDPSILRTNQNGLVTSNVFVYAYDVSASPGQTMDYKYHIDQNDNWDSPTPGTGDPNDNNNRFFVFGTNATQALPIVFFSDQPYVPVGTNDITFQVDLSAQVQGGLYDPSNPANIVQVRGDFNGWAGTNNLVNDPSGPNTNLYRTTVRIVGGAGAFHSYKFWATGAPNTGWEIVNKDPGLNRSLRIISGTTQVLPPVYFSDTSVGDLMSTDTVATISVDMTGAVGTDSHPFNPVNDTVWIGGISFDATLWRWQAPFSATDVPMQLTNNPVGSMIYTLDLTITKGWPLGLTYKYGINQNNDEPNGNHVSYVYTPGAYTLPLDKFGVAVTENATPNLNASRSPGHVNLTWLGRPGVFLQNKATLAPGAWTPHPETDGQSATNWPTSGSSSFFRLVKP
jgi:hypothetical protein